MLNLMKPFLALSEESENRKRALIKTVVETDGIFIGRAYLEHLQSHTSQENETFIHKYVAPGL